MANTSKKITLREILNQAKVLNGILLFLSFFMAFASHSDCELCKSDYRVPTLAELKPVNGTYTAIRKFNNMDSGGLLTKDHPQPSLCGYLKEEFIGMPAKGWFDADGHIYQLEVNGHLVCDYKAVIEDKTQAPTIFHLFLFLLCTLTVVQIALWKFSQSRTTEKRSDA